MLDSGGLGSRLAPEVRAAWIAAMPRLLAACQALGDLGVPDTLVHGDLHPHNIALTPRGPLVVDWSDGAVGHPLLDLAVFLRRTKARDLRRRLRDAYIDGWDGVVAHARLQDAVTLAMAVGAAYQVETYQALLPAMDAPDRAAFEGADERWLQQALDGLEQGLDAGLS
jgi:aminoglycoside phosphotransferase (APT) family kinase protein